MRLSLGLLLASLVLFAGCSLLSSSTVARCDLRKNTPSPQECREISKAGLSEISSGEVACKALNGAYATAPCETAGILAGCEKMSGSSLETRWYYASDGFQNVEDVRATCKGDERLVDAQGNTPAPSDAGVTLPGPAATTCSVSSTTAATVRFVNNTSGPVTTWWVDYKCKETKYVEIAAGAQFDQGTFVSHPWRVRSTASKELLIDFAGATMSGTTTVTVP
jgi:hypothetical protein